MVQLVESDPGTSGADARWTAVGTQGQPLSGCSLWWTRAPELAGQRLGIIGQYSASDPDAGRLLLDGVCRLLATCGCTLAVGPMDGNTWRSYRFVTERGSEPPFFLEPDHPDDWPAHFAANGFQTLSTYHSALNHRLCREDEHVAAARQRLTLAGVTVRAIETATLNEELRGIYAVALAAFSNAFLFSPLPEAAFVAMYQQMTPSIVADLVLVAERDALPVGFVFAVPDHQQAARGEPVTTMVIKTIAVVPDRRLGGLGRVLAWECEQRAAALGFTRSIHALMPAHGKSANISRDQATTFRRYALLSRALG